MKKVIIGLILSTLLLSACDTSFTELIYRNRLKFTFLNEDETTNYTYLCKPDENVTESEKEAATKIKAKQAHTFMMEGLKASSEKFVEDLMDNMKESEAEGDDGFSFIDAFSQGIQFQKDIEKLATDAEAKFQCILSGTVELED